MRYIFRFILSVVIISLSYLAISFASGVPHLINYQGKAATSNGNPVVNGTHDVWFFLYTSSSGASYVWSDNVSIQTNDGLFSYILGSDPTSPLTDSLFIKYDSLFLGVIFDGELQAPLTPFTAVPFAFRVNSLDKAKGGDVKGHLALIDTTIGPYAFYAQLREDNNGGGAGYFEVYDSWGSIGFIVDGNFNGTGEPRTVLMGDDRSVSMNMSDSLSNSVMLPTDAVEALEILDEPGVGSCVNTFVDLDTYIQNLCGRTMFAPADGYVLVTSTANVSISHNTGTPSYVYFGVSDNISAYVNSAKINIVLPAVLPSGTYYYPLMSQALFPISKGSHAYYVLGSRSSVIAEVYSIQFTEVFYPTAYTTVHNPSSPPGSDLPTLLSPDDEQKEAEAFHKKRIEDELKKISSQIEKLKLELEQE